MPPPSQPESSCLQFDANLSADDNIRTFLNGLKQQDPDLAAVLETHHDELLKLPEDAAQRGIARSALNKTIAGELDKLTEIP